MCLGGIKIAKGGFTQYLETGEITQDFLDDVKSFCLKVYSWWTLMEDFDEFYNGCLAKIPAALKIYNSDFSALSTYIFSVIMNEARRIHSGLSRYVSQDVLEVPNPNFVNMADSSLLFTNCLELRQQILRFAQYAFFLGIHVDQAVLYRQLTYSEPGFLSTAFFSFRVYHDLG